ncbi:hypothetical protein [Clostridium beijerinckii]|nr:hypothetical protein [Clostridium beijerinckii]
MCDTQDGWVNTEDDNSGTWYYYEDGEVTTGWKVFRLGWKNGNK